MEKPDFKVESLKAGHVINKDAYNAFTAGCEHVWNTHVVPLQDQVRDLETANDNQRRTITVQAEGIRNTGYIFSRICADNGEHSHWTAIRMSDGAKVWSECPEECKAMGHAVEASEEFERLESENKALRDSLSSSERFRAEDAASHINEANALREEIERLKQNIEARDKTIDQLTGPRIVF